jgi:hypothetical protein
MIADVYDIDPDTDGEPILSGQPHPVEWVRDIPRTCICEWEWNPKARAYDLFTDKIGCPWHGHGRES